MSVKKFPYINGYAPGYWGTNIRQRIVSERLSQKVLSLNIDKQLAMSLPFAVWREAESILDSPVQCSCYKDTAKQADVPCLSCYGTGALPGYIKFGTKTYWSSSIDAGWTFTNMFLDQDNRPFRLRIADGQLYGSAISAPIPVVTVGKLGPWEWKYDGFTRDGGMSSSIDVQVSTDGGTTFGALTNLNVGTFSSVVFKVLMTRSTVKVKSPMFEIIRFRYPNIFDIMGEVQEPVMRFLPTWDHQAEYRGNFGVRLDVAGKRFWSLPMSFFDKTIVHGSKQDALADDMFAEARYGMEPGVRYGFLDYSYSETFHEFTRQEFSLRRFTGVVGGATGEIFMKVW